MFPASVLAAYCAACVLVVLSPGPDNLLAISRGLSQGRLAAATSALGSALGILVHTLAATFGLSLLIQQSSTAFWAVKLVGAAYLIWLGLRAWRSGDLVSFQATTGLPLRRVLATAALTNVLNPKPALFVLAFLPQFADASRGSIAAQMLVFGVIFCLFTVVIFTLMGTSAARLTGWLRRHPRAVRSVNAGAGTAFVAAGLSVLALRQRSPG